MKRILFFFVWLLTFPATLYAQTMYIHEVMKITLRTGPGTNHKIISMVESGQSVQMMEKKEEWSLVKTSGGKEGWVLNRFLTDKVPTGLLYRKLESDYQKLEGKYNALLESTQSSTTENDALKTELATIKKQYEEISAAYESLKQGASDYFKLKSDYESAEKQLAEQTGTLDILKEKLQQKYLEFFLFGAGVLLLGIIIGIIFKSGRKHSSLY